MRDILVFIFLLVYFLNFAQGNKLFSNDSALDVTIYYNSTLLIKNRDEKSGFQKGKLQLNTDASNFKEFNIELKTRGIFRLKKQNCYFPPLELKFDKKEIKNSIFKGNSKLKLVLPCRKSDNYQQYLLLEYLAYRIYNQLTEFSFRVKLLQIKLIDLDEKEPAYERYGFLIEPFKSLEKRLQGKELKVKNLHPDLMDRQLMNLTTIYEYMIGNTDWSVKALHNIKILGRDSLKNPVAIPYDFDFSGLVNAPYASAAEQLNLSSVKQRYYNGYSRNYDEIMENVLIFKSKKDTIYKLVNSLDGLKKHYIDETLKYFDQFYEILDDSNVIKQEFIEKCRKD